MNTAKTGLLIQALRKSKGLTQNELADILNVSSKTVSKWECGDALPEITTLLLISDFFELTVDELLKGEKANANKPLSEDTQSRFQSRKERFVKSRTVNKITLFSLISIGLLIAGYIVILIFFYALHIALLILSVLLVISSLVLILIGNASSNYEYDEAIKATTVNEIRMIKFFYSYVYVNLSLLPLVVLLIIGNTAAHRILFLIVLTLVPFILYYYLKEKRYGEGMPLLVRKIVHVQRRYNAIYLFLLIYTIGYFFFTQIYSYHVNQGTVHYSVMFYDILSSLPTTLFLLGIALLVLSISTYIAKFFIQKTYGLEMLFLGVLSLFSIRVIIQHYNNRMAWLQSGAFTSYGYSSLDVGPLEFVLFALLVSIIGYYVVAALSSSRT